MSDTPGRRVDRRTSIKWVLAASVSASLVSVTGLSAAPLSSMPRISGYGTDPDLQRNYEAGELWPLTFTSEQRRMASALCDLILPEDGHSPSASAVGVVDFIDEWISAPYAIQQADRSVVIAGFAWLQSEVARRFSGQFDTLRTEQQAGIIDPICYLPEAPRELRSAAAFFARYRDLTVGGFYTTPVGRADLRFIGNSPLPQFEGPPREVLERVGLWPVRLTSNRR